MKLLFYIVWISALADTAATFKIAIFVPDNANSQAIWSHRVAQTLQKAGHQVTLINLVLIPIRRKKLPPPEGIEEWNVLQYTKESGTNEILEMIKDVFGDTSFLTGNERRLMGLMRKASIEGCKGYNFIL
ncbi:unnamed protein product [Enterobius vermicularis]|uniref:Glucuronosyltransferase n=1 Tax=Enterobius vermicularis TaxID=51028 RepID=A0A0N4VPW3_ENTVE|nr:unnamed protein product [Enterobius vermicularis]